MTRAQWAPAARVYDAVFFTSIIVLVLLLAWTVPPVRAKASEPVPDCVAIGKAGASVVSRCTDVELSKVCYITTAGFMFCLDE